MRNLKSPLSILAIGVVCAAALAGCPRQGEGPAERVGKGVDSGVSAVGRGIEKTGDAIEDAAEGR
jgi:predicted small secreted protein